MPGTRVHGYDVIVDEVPNRTEFIPPGSVVMELSTRGSPRQKADEDYEARRDEEESFRLIHAYVAVTARPFQDAAAWAASKVALGEWREVRALNSARLAAWLNATPDVALMYATELGLADNSAFQTLDSAWKAWSHGTTTPITEELVLCQRDQERQQLLDRIQLRTGTTAIEADSSEEAYGFLLAALRKLPNGGQTGDNNLRVIVAETASAARGLSSAITGLVVVIRRRDEADLEQLASRHVVLMPAVSNRKPAAVVRLTRPSIFAFAEALQAAGFAPRATGTSLDNASQGEAQRFGAVAAQQWALTACCSGSRFEVELATQVSRRSRAPSLRATLSGRVHGVEDGFNCPVRRAVIARRTRSARCRARAKPGGVRQSRPACSTHCAIDVGHEISIVYASAPGMLEHRASCQPHPRPRMAPFTIGRMARQFRLG
jgi:hypothetical protein